MLISNKDSVSLHENDDLCVSCFDNPIKTGVLFLYSQLGFFSESQQTFLVEIDDTADVQQFQQNLYQQPEGRGDDCSEEL